MEWLEVKKWREYQHYKDRCPPWIKLHVSVLNDRDFILLSRASKGLLMQLWILASENDGKVPYDLQEIQFRLRDETIKINDINLLITKGFFKNCKQMLSDASKCYSETETETETEKRESRAKPPQINIREFVKISEEDLKKLSASYKKEELEWMFDKLDAWQGAKERPKIINAYGYFRKGSWLLEEIQKHFNQGNNRYISKAPEPDTEGQEYRDKVLKQFTPEQLATNRKRLAALSNATFKTGL